MGYGMVSHCTLKRDVLMPYNDARIRCWRVVLLYVATISCIAMPLALGVVQIRDQDLWKILSERCIWENDRLGYIMSLLFLLAELTLIATNAVIVGIIIPRSLRSTPIEEDEE